VTAVVERTDKFQAEYVPPPPPPAGKFVVRAPADEHGRPICADLHLTPDMAEQLALVLLQAIEDVRQQQ
jgi:hypothetical protein